MNNQKHQLTIEGLEKLKAELNKLETVDRQKNIEDLKEARAQGDLSENAEYDAARAEQARIEARVTEIKAIIKNHVLIDGDQSSNLGKKITVYFEDTEEEEEYTLVGSLESNPLEGKISNESPLGASILKAKVGQRILIKTESDEFNIVIKNIK
jgi:transcription elongation factor GreA